MLNRLARWYSRRIVNVNVNIVLAGMLALIPTVIAVHLTRYVLESRGDRLFRHEKLIIAVVTLVVDVVSDVAIYYLLHWLANHMPLRRKSRLAAHPHDAAQDARPKEPALSFFRDATLVQVARMLMSPLLYGIFLGTQYALIRHHVPREAATVIGFVLGVTTTRVLHTIYMLRQERRAARLLTPVV